jgi:hypothetical protein
MGVVAAAAVAGMTGGAAAATRDVGASAQLGDLAVTSGSVVRTQRFPRRTELAVYANSIAGGPSRRLATVGPAIPSDNILLSSGVVASRDDFAFSTFESEEKVLGSGMAASYYGGAGRPLLRLECVGGLSLAGRFLLHRGCSGTEAIDLLGEVPTRMLDDLTRGPLAAAGSYYASASQSEISVHEISTGKAIYRVARPHRTDYLLELAVDEQARLAVHYRVEGTCCPAIRTTEHLAWASPAHAYLHKAAPTLGLYGEYQLIAMNRGRIFYSTATRSYQNHGSLSIADVTGPTVHLDRLQYAELATDGHDLAWYAIHRGRLILHTDSVAHAIRTFSAP